MTSTHFPGRFYLMRLVGLPCLAFHAALVLTLAMCSPSQVAADNLYISENVARYNSIGSLIDMKSSVLRFDAFTAAYVDTFVAPGSGSAFGLRGLVFDANHNLIAVDQNVGQPTNGEILKYRGSDGVFLGNLVPEPAAPYAPRGVVLSPDRKSLFVADMGDFGPNCESLPGGVYRYDAVTGQLSEMLSSPAELGDLHPRGLVFGPDGLLYATDFGNPCAPHSGSIVRFDPATGQFVDQFVPAQSGTLHWPEGLVFAPDGSLYAMSARSGPDNVSQIQQFDGTWGTLIRSIDLGEVDDALSPSAQALLFGPNDKLYVAIENRNLTDLQAGVERVVSGELRRYDVQTAKYETLVAPGGRLKDPGFLTFDNTDPATLAYIAPNPGLLGDFDADGVLGSSDIDQLTDQVLVATNLKRFDLNGDSIVNQEDRNVWISQLKKTWYGDADLDGDFDSSDLVRVFSAGEYEDVVAGNSGWSDGDWNGDHDFTSSDLVVAFADGGYERGLKPAVRAVPEPTHSLVMLATLCSLGIRRVRHH